MLSAKNERTNLISESRTNCTLIHVDFINMLLPNICTVSMHMHNVHVHAQCTCTCMSFTYTCLIPLEEGTGDLSGLRSNICMAFS